jgi:hypothetical protein
MSSIGDLQRSLLISLSPLKKKVLNSHLIVCIKICQLPLNFCKTFRVQLLLNWLLELLLEQAILCSGLSIRFYLSNRSKYRSCSLDSSTIVFSP